uniref:Putative secreted protein n=1 Tax=Anopheles darlingi TaxID=43151 RepID=A0A2M4DGD4_ANODA
MFHFAPFFCFFLSHVFILREAFISHDALRINFSPPPKWLKVWPFIFAQTHRHLPVYSGRSSSSSGSDSG